MSKLAAQQSRINFNINDLRSYVMLSEQLQEKGLKNSGLDETRTLTPATPVQCSNI